MDKIEIRTKALELTLQMFSIFSRDKVEEELNKLSGEGSIQHKLVSAAAVFELYLTRD
jgi:hypothetical protein